MNVYNNRVIFMWCWMNWWLCRGAGRDRHVLRRLPGEEAGDCGYCRRDFVAQRERTLGIWHSGRRYLLTVTCSGETKIYRNSSQ